MPKVSTKELFEDALKGGYAVGAFNVNNMEIIQGIVEAAEEEKAPLILQISKGARKYARHEYLMKLIEAALELSDLPIAVHLDHGDSFELCKSCIDEIYDSDSDEESIYFEYTDDNMSYDNMIDDNMTEYNGQFQLVNRIDISKYYECTTCTA